MTIYREVTYVKRDKEETCVDNLYFFNFPSFSFDAREIAFFETSTTFNQITIVLKSGYDFGIKVHDSDQLKWLSEDINEIMSPNKKLTKKQIDDIVELINGISNDLKKAVYR